MKLWKQKQKNKVCFPRVLYDVFIISDRKNCKSPATPPYKEWTIRYLRDSWAIFFCMNSLLSWKFCWIFFFANMGIFCRIFFACGIYAWLYFWYLPNTLSPVKYLMVCLFMQIYENKKNKCKKLKFLIYMDNKKAVSSITVGSYNCYIQKLNGRYCSYSLQHNGD